jgi:hypothetical protein
MCTPGSIGFTGTGSEKSGASSAGIAQSDIYASPFRFGSTEAIASATVSPGAALATSFGEIQRLFFSQRKVCFHTATGAGSSSDAAPTGAVIVSAKFRVRLTS